MESEDIDLPVSQKSFCNDLDNNRVIPCSVDETENADGDFNYLSQVCEPSDFTMNCTPADEKDSGFVSESGTIPLVPYDDEDDASPQTDDETPNFFFGLLDDSFTDDLAAPLQPVPATQSQSDSNWLLSQGINFDPAEW